MIFNGNSCGACFTGSRKNSFACYPLLCVAFIFVMSIFILFSHFGGATLFQVVRCLPIMMLRDRALSIIF
jgi:hypothetical protein